MEIYCYNTERFIMINVYYLSAIFLLYISSNVRATKDRCLSFDVLLSQNIENLGFHRELKWLLEVTHPGTSTLIKNECSFAVELDMPPSLFVNPDELADLQRLGILKTFIGEFVDVELTEHEATNHTVYIFIETNDFSKVTLTLPFHARYQRSQISGGYGKAVLNKPRLLVRCLQTKEKLCEKFSTEAPCDFRGDEKCQWFDIKYKPLLEVNEMLVPVGDLDHYPLVSIVTLSIGCMGCIYILSLFSVFSKKPI